APETFAAPTPSDAAFSPYAPDRIVWAWSAPASSSEAALDAAALDTHGWSDALARFDVRIEGPGHLLLAPDELARRREALGALGRRPGAARAPGAAPRAPARAPRAPAHRPARGARAGGGGGRGARRRAAGSTAPVALTAGRGGPAPPPDLN